MIKEVIAALLDGQDLAREQAADTMREIMSGGATDAQIAGFLIALRVKGETAHELAGCVEVMREKVTRIPAKAEHLVDTCGTGGDRSGTFNISTATALVAAGAGATVAKHGNRSVSSHSGSADVMKELGVNIDISPERVARCLEKVGMAFLFAPLLHAAMKYAIGPRRELGVRTIFNILGPLTNPAGARRQLIGVYSADLAELVAKALLELGAERALVVYGRDGLDEITTSDRTAVWEVSEGKLKAYDLDPLDLGVPRTTHEELVAKDAADSAAMIGKVLAGERGPCRDAVVLNSAGALYASDIAVGFEDGMAKAAESIDTGRASRVLERLVEETNRQDAVRRE